MDFSSTALLPWLKTRNQEHATYHTHYHKKPACMGFRVAKDTVDGRHLMAEPCGEDLSPHQALVQAVSCGQVQQSTVLQV